MVGVAVIETLIASKEEDIKIGSQIYYYNFNNNRGINWVEGEGEGIELICHI